MVTSSHLRPLSLDTRLHSQVTRYMKVTRATTSCRPHAILVTGENPYTSTRRPEPARLTNLDRMKND